MAKMVNKTVKIEQTLKSGKMPVGFMSPLTSGLLIGALPLFDEKNQSWSGCPEQRAT
jgi:hypothetical protein